MTKLAAPIRVKKTYPARFKVVDEEQGIVEQWVSVFNNVDLGGDRVLPGFFSKSLQRWKESGDPIPAIFSHQWENLDAYIGEVLEAKEMQPGDAGLPEEIRDLGGLYARYQLDLEEAPAAKVFKLLKKRVIREASFAYDVYEKERGDDGAMNLIEGELIELGPTLKGMNPLTQTGVVKADSKAFVTLEGSYEQLQAKLREAIRGWAQALPELDLFYAGLEATFADYAVGYVEEWSDPWDGGTYYKIAYTRDSNNIELGMAQAVNLSGTVTPKSRHFKEGRRHSSQDEADIQSVHDLACTLGAVCSSDESSDDDGKSKAKPEEPEAVKGKEPMTSPESVLLLTELEALSL